MMDHDEILQRLYAHRRLEIGSEIRRDKAGAELRRASRLNHLSFWQRLISWLTRESPRFKRPSQPQVRGGVTDLESTETAVTTG
jgi:hypothetical protein